MNSNLFWIWLASIDGVSLNAKAEIIEVFGTAENAWNAKPGIFFNMEGISAREAEILEKRNLDKANEIVSLCSTLNIRTVTIDDKEYPPSLKEIFAPPYALYMRGSVPIFSDISPVAVIGTRKASPYGLKMGKRIAYELCRCGATVVSGLTAGIDTAAAEGALSAGGRVIGILGTPIDAAKSDLALKICEEGTLISEYAPGTRQKKYFFRDRNRIAAGISKGVVVVEAPEKSGTRLFVAEALEQGKQIFALPGNADSDNSAGTLKLIKEGAMLVTHGWEVAEELALYAPEGSLNIRIRETFSEKTEEISPTSIKPENTKKKVQRKKAAEKLIDNVKSDCYIGISELTANLADAQKSIVSSIAAGKCKTDEIIESTGLSASEVLTQLTILEIKGIISRNSDGFIMQLQKK